MNRTHILRIDCADRKGLVHAITGVLFRSGLNITSTHEFVDRETQHFFMRTEFAGELDREMVLGELHASLPEDTRITLSEKRRKDVIIMATREHHCLGDLLLRHRYGELNASVLAVVSNHNDLGELAEKFEIPFHCVSHNGMSREEHEDAILKVVDLFAPEYIVLARYMRILSHAFVDRFPNRIINIHHSFLPAFIGANPYRQAYERGVKIIGATAHFVNHSLDEGPIIAQSVIPVDHTFSVDDMQQAGRDGEKVVLARALKLAFEDKIFVNGNKTVIFE
ncbi:MAG: formyltetrahydrofolate deformylase [Spirochaetes bacterium]|nr:formyltetrahydrofolate deformylase [Spirochaetota bacterium]RPI91040.1 MAG: formyltetrahydrofolate deformylase [Spirochaetales bacterium]